jgi:hypothetical protein
MNKGKIEKLGNKRCFENPVHKQPMQDDDDGVDSVLVSRLIKASPPKYETSSPKKLSKKPNPTK